MDRPARCALAILGLTAMLNISNRDVQHRDSDA